MTVVTFTAVLLIVLYSLIAISSLVSRIRQRDAERPSKMPLWPVPPIIALVGCGLAITQQKTSDLLVVLGIFVAGLIYFYVFLRPHRDKYWIHELDAEELATGRSREVDMADLAVVRSIVPAPEQYAWTFGGCEPIMRVRPGDVLDLFTEDAFGGRIRTSGDLPSETIVYPFINPQTGPFFVEGAEPGDTLAIHLIDVQPARDWAVSTTVPLFGALTGTKYTPTLQPALPERTWRYAVDLAAREVIYQALDSAFSVRLPLLPFLGTIGVAPAADEARNVLVPEAFGGNMDTPEAQAGTTVYLGVNVEGRIVLDRRRALHHGRGRGLRGRRRRRHEHPPRRSS